MCDSGCTDWRTLARRVRRAAPLPTPPASAGRDRRGTYSSPPLPVPEKSEPTQTKRPETEGLAPLT